MSPPPDFHTPHKNLVCRLRKSIFGLRQGSRCWFSKLTRALKQYGLVQSYVDYSLFTLRRGSSQLHVLVNFDDLIISGNDSKVIQEFKTYLSS